MRAFVAIDTGPLPADRPARSSPLAPDHLTLRFFADLPDDRRPVVEAVLDRVASERPPFRLQFDGVGAFPNAARPRIVYVAVGEGRASVEAIAARIDDGLAAAGMPGDGRPFVPHRTVVRVRTARDRNIADEWLRDPPAPWEITVHELVLKQSVLTPQGARHTVLHRSPLGGAGPT